MNIEQKTYYTYTYINFLLFAFLAVALGSSLHFVNTHTFIEYDAKYQIDNHRTEERIQENEK